MPAITVASPAKVNLFLAVTGRRPDGFHDLLSVAAPLDWGDRLTAELSGDSGPDTLRCDDPGVPLDETNLILRAARSFREATGWAGRADFSLEKRIPIGAGLGGGSSNAVAALRALNELRGRPLGDERLRSLAADLGSDCVLFLDGKPCVMRGRGEAVEDLPPAAAARVAGLPLILFKPDFPIATAWAYSRFAELHRSGEAAYLPLPQAEARLERWIAGTDGAGPLLFNQLEAPAFRKYPALPALLARLRGRFGLDTAMSGSGSCCFALLPEPGLAATIADTVRQAWGDCAWVGTAQISG